MIDNFEIIEKLLTFESEDDYYFVQILMRAKDHPGLGSNNRLIKTYVIKSLEHFDHVKDEIKTICDTFKARAYIHLTKRSFHKVSLIMLKELALRIASEQYIDIHRCFNTASGLYYSKHDKTWIIDIDTEEDKSKIYDIINYVNKECSPDGDKFITLIKTIHGVHIITTPFNVDQFKMRYPCLDVHKNNPTNLYTPCL